MNLAVQFKKGILEAGIDEAGRGCLAGPVVAAAVILPPKFKLVGLTDSKQIREDKRYELRNDILEKALAWNVGIISNERIDQINILNATFEAMHEAVKGLTTQPEHLLIDGKLFLKNYPVPFRCEIKGDGRFLNIAAASILAKTFRDDIMKMLHNAHPNYNWKDNKGYGTPRHYDAIEEFGLTQWHRKSFRLFKPITLFSEVR